MHFKNANQLVRTIIAGCSAVAALALSGCFDTTLESSPVTGVIYCSEGNPTSFNPQLDTSSTTSDASSHQIYDRLLNFDPQSGKIVPALASSWLISNDGLTYTFQLRRGVKFHNTEYFAPSRTFNADDVIFSIERWRDKIHPFHYVSGGSYPFFTSIGLDDLISKVNRINGYRVEITLSRPDSSFLANLATDFAVILSAEYAQKLTQSKMKDRIDNYPIGTGPFKFKEYKKDHYIRYQKHQDYWLHDKAPQKLIFDITTTSSLRLAKLMTGECDAIAFPAHSELDTIREREDLTLDGRPGLNVGFWAFNTSKYPFDNPKVRRALAMAIDKNTLLEAVYYGSAVSAKSLLPESSWAYQSDTTETNYNPVLARKLLRESGIDEGFTINIWAMPVERAYNPNARKMAELMQNYLIQVGIQVNIVSYEWTTFREKLKEGLHDSVLIGWSADNGDPDNFYRPLLSCSAIESGTNRAMWCSQEYDSLINQALQYSEIEQRIEYYKLANKLIAEQMPLVPLAHAYRYRAHRRDLSGLVINPFGAIRFGDVEKQ
ncbi:ABC transporter substrate-binding protein SapA [Aliiglaciecola sp. 3_MG-2023]|uniref:ABC transporter substrate-binding protein SapA n=1 Tax=Aliiglaciecola sp. 3_MG-2023 TaxID=3062644 RepID=UPI0026E1AB18|nr:ABC transporter substrate-binding protein SapA [Aliiglaciecola sp. 3_MG-2023]MDO6695761.1 ABC transporter substrate-binding protein SapA [Aliiglaciecola sp. 3_MG-2023]